MRDRVILDLCGGTGSWSAPYRDASYTVIVVDPLAGNNPMTVADWLRANPSPEPIHGVLAAPPCTHFSGSGARWWPAKDADGRTSESCQVVRDCLEVVRRTRPTWWALENPVGRMRRLVPEVGGVVLQFDPCDYGDPYTKRTQLFGRFTLPVRSPVAITHARGSSPIHRAAPGPDRWRIRSKTPAGFARAFFEANP